MKAFLHHALVKTKIKEGFLVKINDTFKIVDSVDNGYIFFPDKTDCLESELEGAVVKLLAIVSGSTPYSIFNRDYDKVIDILLDSYPGYDNGLQAYLDGERIDLTGTILHKTISVEMGSTVRLTNIRHIDKYHLYDYPSRNCELVNYKDYYYQLKNGNSIIKCKREDFTIIEGENTRSFFQIQCKHCLR